MNRHLPINEQSSNRSGPIYLHRDKTLVLSSARRSDVQRPRHAPAPLTCAIAAAASQLPKSTPSNCTPSRTSHTPKMPQELLIDVRSPLEFSTGPLVSDIATTVNIEYTAIDSLAEIYALQNVSVSKDDHITLYCRSGRRSDIAKRRLEQLGYRHVRDIGGFDDARRVLDRETVARQLEGMAGEDRKDAKDGGAVAVKSDGKEEVRQKSLDALLAGLKECDE
jgi:rhodanese-related sulfurtransferase